MKRKFAAFLAAAMVSAMTANVSVSYAEETAPEEAVVQSGVEESGEILAGSGVEESGEALAGSGVEESGEALAGSGVETEDAFGYEVSEIAAEAVLDAETSDAEETEEQVLIESVEIADTADVEETLPLDAGGGLVLSYEEFVEVPFGQDVVLSVDALSDSDMVEYQWYEGIPNEDIEVYDWRVLSEETGASLELKNVVAYGFYMCEVYDGYDTENAYIEVSVDSGLSLEYDSDISVIPGEGTLLEVKAVSDYDISYQWYQYRYDEFEWVLLAGEVRETLAVEAVIADEEYKCVVSDVYTTREAYFHVYVDSGLTISYDSGVIIEPGGSAVLQVNAATIHGQTLTYQWYRYDGFITEELEGENSASFTVGAVAGEYECKVSDGYETRWAHIYVSVNSGF